jgi:UDP-glucose 4-epimerase
MRILVTGGAGFVGTHLVAALAAMADTAVVAADVAPWDAAADRFLAPVRTRVTFANLDVLDAAAMARLVRQERITHIVHAAAITVADAQERARASEIVRVNLIGAYNVLNLAMESETVTRVLLISSSGVYAVPQGKRSHPQCETDPLDLANLYAITKYSSELLAARYAQLSGKLMASVRLPAVYGPLERPRSSRPSTSALRRLMDALHARRAVVVAGPRVARDWTYTADVGAAVAALLRAPRWRHTVYNVSCGQSTPFADVVAAFAERGLAATWTKDAGQADVAMRPQQRRAALDIARLCADTDFLPQYDIRSGIAAWLVSEPAH